MRCTILIPTHNRPEGLRRAVLSAALALPQDSEILIVDDHSDPPALDKFKELSETKLRMLRCGSNTGGAAAARNLGLTQANGDIVFFLDDDDEMEPDYCHHILDHVLPNHPEMAWGFSHVKTAVSKANQDVPKIIETSAPLPEGPLIGALSQRLAGFGAGFWIRQEVWENLGPIDESFATNEDTEYSLRLAASDHLGWYSIQPGTIVHKALANSTDIGHVTSRTNSDVRARGFLKLLSQYDALLRSHPRTKKKLQQRFIELASKTQKPDLWQDFRTAFPSAARRMYLIYKLLRWMRVARPEKDKS